MVEPALQTSLPLRTVPEAPPLRLIPSAPASPGAAPRPLRNIAPRLEIPPYELTAALRLERELGISHVLSQVLVRRGLGDPAQARAFLDPSEERHDPERFAGIDVALEQIRSHIAGGSRIV